MSKPSLEELVSKESLPSDSLPLEGKASRSRTKRKSDSRTKQGENIKNSNNSISFYRQDNGSYVVEIPANPKSSKLKETEILYDMLKNQGKVSKFFEQPNREKFDKSNLQDLRQHIYNSRRENPTPKEEMPKKRVRLLVSEDFKKEFDEKVNASNNIFGPIKEKVEQEVPKGGIQESPEGASQEGGFQEIPESPKQNMIVLYDNAQKALANVGIETPLDNLLLPRDLKERFLANPDDSIDDVIREASKNYAINVYRQRYKDIEDNSFRSFLEDAINEGLINPYKYFDKNREERVMYLFGDKAMTEPELREEFNKYRFKNLIKGNKNKLHEAAERAIMKKREKQLKAYEEMKQTTHDEIRPKMVLNPMLFNHA